MGLPCVAVTSLIIPFGQVPSSTSTVAPFLMSNGSFLVTTWALQVPLTAANKINAAGLIMCVFMSKVHDVPVRRIRPSQIQKASKFNGGRPGAKRRFWCVEEAPLSRYHCRRLRLPA